MANHTITDFVPDYGTIGWHAVPGFEAARVRTLSENTALFNGALSANGGVASAITLNAARSLGSAPNETIEFTIADEVVQRRDPTSIAPVADTRITSVGGQGIKVNTRFGPVLDTEDKFIKVGLSPSAQAVIVGRWIAQRQTRDYAISAFSAAVAALKGMTDTPLVLDVSSQDGGTTPGSKLDVEVLIDAMALMGDQSSRLGALVGTSSAYFDLMKNHVLDDKATVADMVIKEGGNPTFGKPFLMTDNASLMDLTDPADKKNYTLLLRAGGIQVSESEGQARMYSQTVLGLENVANRIQGEHAYNLGMSGMRWDVANGGTSPSNAALATSANWDFYANDPKDAFGVLIITDR